MLSSRGMEAINFLAGSTLAKNLTKVFQKVIDYRDSLEYMTDDPEKIRDERIFKVYKYLREQMIPDFIDTVKRETNLEITKVIMTGTKSMSGFFAVNLAFDSEPDAIDMLNIQTGQEPAPKTFRDSLKEMVTMCEQFDVKTGKLKKSTYGTGNKRKICCKMYMDGMMAFLLHDFVPTRICPTFSAEELAAIYLHEIGHVLTVVERSGDLYSTVTRQTDHLLQTLKTTDKKQALKDFMELGTPTLTKLVKDKKVDPKLGGVSIKALESASYLLEKESSSLIGAAAEILNKFIFHVIFVNFYLILNAILFMHFEYFFVGLAKEFAWIEEGKKSTDATKTEHSLYQMERLADEFVSRHGFGSHLASALNKMDSLGVAMALSQTDNVRLRKSGAFYAYTVLAVFVFKLMGGTLTPSYNYEDQYSRLKRLVQNAHASFKNNLDKILLDEYITEYERLNRELDSIKKKVSYKASDFIYKYFLQYAQPSTILASLLTGRLLHDYEKQQNLIEDLINNQHYYLSAKFKQLANKA